MDKNTWTMEGLRDRLFETLDKLRAGKVSVAEARTTAALAFQIIDSVRVEIIYRAASLPDGANEAAKKLGYQDK